MFLTIIIMAENGSSVHQPVYPDAWRSNVGEYMYLSMMKQSMCYYAAYMILVFAA